jgi:hypothetical protein
MTNKHQDIGTLLYKTKKSYGKPNKFKNIPKKYEKGRFSSPFVSQPTSSHYQTFFLGPKMYTQEF